MSHYRCFEPPLVRPGQAIHRSSRACAPVGEGDSTTILQAMQKCAALLKSTNSLRRRSQGTKEGREFDQFTI